jgi:hypothetical protein
VPVPNRSNNHSANSHEWIFPVLFGTIPVSSASKQENKQGSYQHNTRDSKSQGPAEVILDVDQHDECYGDAN